MVGILRTLLILAICTVAGYYLFTYAIDEFNSSTGVSLKVAEQINILGQIDHEKVNTLVKSGVRGMESCWNIERKNVEGFSGIVRVEAQVNNTGETVKTNCSLLAGESPGNRFQSCICSRVNKWRFPPSGTLSNATVIFQIQPADQ